MKGFFLRVACVSLEKWHEVADTGSQSALELEPGLSWAADLAVLEFDGLEAAKFLQGYLTCDTEALATDRWQPTALCNLKGRVVANGWVTTDAQGSLWLLVHQSLAEHCLAFLHKYLVFAKAQGHNRSAERVVIMGVTQAVPAALTARTFALPQSEAWLGLATLDQSIELWQQAPLLTPNSQFNRALLGAGLALVTNHSSEQYLPQMLGLADSGAIDFDKGCYLGQEIVARAQHRGSVKRQLARLEWYPGSKAQQSLDAADLSNDSRSVGKIINWQIAANSEGTHLGTALAVVSIKDEVFPATVSHSPTIEPATAAADTPTSSADTSSQPTLFQVHKIEN